MILSNATIVTMDSERRILQGDLRVRGDVISEVGGDLIAEPGEEVINLSGQVLIPGLVQGHIHLCQTLFRNAAEGLALLDWLKTRVWPFEGAHSHASLYATAQLGITELLTGGTTTVLDMGTVHHTDAIFEAARDLGIRAVIGKAMMDAGEGVPTSLKETTDQSLQASYDLMERWDGKENGRLGYAFCPRFVPSCSQPLLKEVASASSRGARVHTHASEMKEEIELVRSMTGMDNLIYLHELGLMGDRSTLAHCVWTNDAEVDLLASTGTHVAHCPGSNLKLASGIAPIPKYLDRGVNVCLGADGPPCNNRLDAFREMALSGLIQKPIHGPKAMPASRIFEMATLGGAAAVGKLDTIGSIEVGKKADLVALDLARSGAYPISDIYACLVYTASTSAVESVWVDGRQVVASGEPVLGRRAETIAQIQREGPKVFQRAGLADLWRS